MGFPNRGSQEGDTLWNATMKETQLIFIFLKNQVLLICGD